MSVLSTQQAAESLGVSPDRVRDMIRSGQLPAQRLGREFMIDSRDLDHVAERKVGRPPAAEADSRRVEQLWEETGGTLLPRPLLLGQPRDDRHARQYADAAIILDGVSGKAGSGLKAELTGRDVLMINTSPYRLSPGLIGRALICHRMAARQKPSRLRSVVLCAATDVALEPHLGGTVEVVADPQAVPVREAPEPRYDRRKLREYWNEKGGLLVEHYPLVPKTESSARRAYPVLVLNEKKKEARVRDDSLSLEGKRVRILHTTPHRLNMDALGHAIVSALLAREARGAAEARSVIWCRKYDLELEGLLTERERSLVDVQPAIKIEDTFLEALKGRALKKR